MFTMSMKRKLRPFKLILEAITPAFKPQKQAGNLRINKGIRSDAGRKLSN